MFPWKWYLSDLANVRPNGLKVFSCFACGGGSSMGYKLAGYTVLGNCEIDPAVAAVYRQNLNPKYSFVMDVRDFLEQPDNKIPQELFELDVLDGSPPCSVFSLAGQREAAWNKEKQFAEGQKFQRLDDLFFVFIAIAKRLRPKVVVAENVTGLVKGNAKGYVNEILKAFCDAGYQVQIFELHAEKMGVPQKRHRIFFVARRRDLALPRLSLFFAQPPITFGTVRSKSGCALGPGKAKSLLALRLPKDRNLGDILVRHGHKYSSFNAYICYDWKVVNTLCSGGDFFRNCDGMRISKEDIVNVSTFPQDYEFTGKSVSFLCGMSVPPVMMANLASEIAKQVFKIQGSDCNAD